jgi:uncharacterized Zn-binding protein involved in type VI secretion
MPNDVGANGQSIVTKKSGGKVITGPDVCKTPSPGGPVPIPYPNISFSSDLANGSKSVKINGVPACLKGSNFSKSSGDQAGSLGGVISGKTGGKAEPVNYSFDVKIEGKSVVRNMDLFQSNDRNTPPGPIMQAPVVMGLGGGSESTEEEPKCPYCNKPEHNFADNWGTHIGAGQFLRKNIIARIEDHPWYTGPNSLQAHHLICSEAMDDDDWSEYCRIFGYSINHKNNGAMFPYLMELACQLHVPLHRGNHDKGMADGVSYPRRIKAELKEIKRDIEAGKYCDNPKALVKKLDSFSKLILKKIGKFSWTITVDGKDYATGKNGCAGAVSLTNKPNAPCPHDRAHGLTKQNEAAALPRQSTPLEIGQ